MTLQVHDTGEEFAIKKLFRDDLLTISDLKVGLFHDGEVSGDTNNGDDLTESDDVGAITTKPSGGSFSLQNSTLDSSAYNTQSNASNNYEAIFDPSPVFDTSDSSQDIDAYYVVANFDSDVAGTNADHLYFTGPLDQLYDLNSVDQFTLQGAGLEAN